MTATKVLDVLPMKHAELLKLTMLVNDDDLDRATMAASSMTNGHLLHAFKDATNEQRQAFYSFNSREEVPDEVAQMICGAKRTSKDKRAAEAIQLQHVRDYAFTESIGGTKGEEADYVLYESANGASLCYAPIVSKLKLNKKRKATAVQSQPDDQQAAAARPDVSHIVLAGRGYSRDEERALNAQLARHGTKDLKVSSRLVAFADKEDLKGADLRATDILKEMFKQHLPKQEAPADLFEESDEEMGADANPSRKRKAAVDDEEEEAVPEKAEAAPVLSDDEDDIW